MKICGPHFLRLETRLQESCLLNRKVVEDEDQLCRCLFAERRYNIGKRVYFAAALYPGLSE
jgi:hypothetical protein